MAGFIVLAGLLALLTLALVLRPLWAARPPLAAALSVVAAAVAASLYLLVGTPQALDPAQVRQPATLDDAIARLEARLEDTPQELEGWRLLGRSYATRGEAAKASSAFARAAALAPDDPDVLVEAAEARALATQERVFDSQAVALLRRALRLQPAHQRARWFLGIAQRQSGDAAGAARTWEPLLAAVDANTAATLRREVDAARADAGLPPLPAAESSASADLVVGVRLDPELAARRGVDQGASVFVIARPVGGPPMPVAVEKHDAAELPLTATLDDSDSPMPTKPLSALAEVEVVARISHSGNAAPQPGDLESKPVRVRLPAPGPIEVVITDIRR